MVLSAENFIKNNYNIHFTDRGDGIMYTEDVEAALIEFAKEHVKEALKQAVIAKKGENELEWYQSNDCPDGMWVPKNTTNAISNAYPESNIF